MSLNPQNAEGFMQSDRSRVPMKDETVQSVLRFWFPLAFALAYSTILSAFPLEVFKDRHNYLVYASASDLILARYAIEGWVGVAANEPLWLLINIGLARFLEPEALLRTVVFIPAFVVSFMLIRNNSNHAFWMILFLLVPQVLKNHIIHLRQGLAISVFVLGYYAGPRWLRLALMGIAGFIHSSFLVIAVIGVMIWTARALRISPALRIVMLIAGSAVMGMLLHAVAGALGARQGAQYAQIELGMSGLGFVFWLCVLSLFVSMGMEFIRTYSFPIGILVFYVSVYFLIPVSARIFESGILFVMLAGIGLGGWRRQVFLSILMLYTFLSYLLRIDQPWLGWGVY